MHHRAGARACPESVAVCEGPSRQEQLQVSQALPKQTSTRICALPTTAATIYDGAAAPESAAACMLVCKCEAHCGCCRYILNNIIVDDYCCWIQSWTENSAAKKLGSLAQHLAKVKISRAQIRRRTRL